MAARSRTIGLRSCTLSGGGQISRVTAPSPTPHASLAKPCNYRMVSPRFHSPPSSSCPGEFSGWWVIKCSFSLSACCCIPSPHTCRASPNLNTRTCSRFRNPVLTMEIHHRSFDRADVTTESGDTPKRSRQASIRNPLGAKTIQSK